MKVICCLTKSAPPKSCTRKPPAMKPHVLSRKQDVTEMQPYQSFAV